MLSNLKKSKKNRKIIAFVSAGIIAVLIAAAVIIQAVTPGIIWFFTPKAKAKDGVIDNIPGIEHIKEVPDGEIKYLINNNVTLKNDNSKGDFMFENPEACKYTLQFFVYQIVGDGKEENVLYTSPVIEPGQYVSGDKLDKELAAGEYACIYFARAYLDGEYIGERSGDMTVSVSE